MTTNARNLRVGVFLAVAIVGLFILVFLLGAKQSLFHSKVHLHASFVSTSGLVVGTSVRLAGVNVGVVEKIAFETDLRDPKVTVRFGISSEFQDRVRADSIASLGSKGLLGDMVLDISVGGPDAARVKDGDELRSQENPSVSDVMRSVQAGVGEVRTLARTATSRIDLVFSDKMAADLGRAVGSVADITDEAAHGQGAVHAMLHDPTLGANLTSFGQSAQRAGASAASVMARVDSMLAQDGVKQLPTDLGRAAKGLANVVTQIQTGDGMAHTLIYERDRSHIMESVAAFSTTLRGVSDDLAQGKGTVGALLKDPTVYQDLKLLLGNVRRSKILRTLVRYTISHDGLRTVSADAK